MIGGHTYDKIFASPRRGSHGGRFGGIGLASCCRDEVHRQILNFQELIGLVFGAHQGEPAEGVEVVSFMDVLLLGCWGLLWGGCPLVG